MDLISRRALLESIDKYYDELVEKHKNTPNHSEAFCMINNLIMEQPTVEEKEMLYGYVKIVVGKMGVMHQECSACGNVLEWKAYPNYCDECGAKLDCADMRTYVE